MQPKTQKEGFEANLHEILPVRVTGKTDADYQLSIPNKIVANGAQLPITFGGDLITTGKLEVQGSLLNVMGETNINKGLTVKNVVSAGQVYKNDHDALPPIGSVMMWMGANVDPDGWVICDGKERNNDGRFDRLLILQIGTGTKSVSYTPPNMTNRFLKGATSTKTGDTYDKPTVTLAVANLPSHVHNGTTDGMNTNVEHSHRMASSDSNLCGTQTGDHNMSDWDNSGGNELNLYGHGLLRDKNTGNQNINHGHTFTTNATGSGTPVTIPDPNFMTVHYILKY